MNRSVGYGHTCSECFCFSRTTRPGCRAGWCNRPGLLNGAVETSPDEDACNVFKEK